MSRLSTEMLIVFAALLSIAVGLAAGRSRTKFQSAGRGQVIGPYSARRTVVNVPADCTKEVPKTIRDADAEELASALRESITKLKANFIGDDGIKVDYDGMKASEDFRAFVALSEKLRSVDISTLSESGKKSAYINIYNSLTVHGISMGLLKKYDTWNRLRYYASASYDIGGQIFSLNDIENGLLRINRPPATPLCGAPFRKNDPRAAHCVSTFDPRIHFTLNCGALSCPPILSYSPNAEELEKEIQLATEVFLEANTRVDEEGGSITTSMLFNWYKDDFGKDVDEIISWMRDHSPPDLQTQIASVIEKCSARGGKVSLQYDEYDFGLNS